MSTIKLSISVTSFIFQASHFKTPITVKEGNEMARRSRSRSRSKSKESDKGKVPREKKDTKGTSKSSKSRKHSKK